ncbi:MAG: MBL fold metallo-hydrolase [Nitrospinae bacterium]|nr:MBL fold metallo-hydrolase [Nitrospinota bacterium]
MEKLDLNKPVEIAKDIFWVGFDDPNAGFRCNPYVLNDGEETVFFDPGSVPHFPIVLGKVMRATQLERIKHVIVTHQDPDLCSAIPRFEELVEGVGGGFDICTHTRASVLIAHYGTRSPFYRVDANDWKLTLKSGRSLRFIFAPFLHFPGAFMTYDEKSKVLFSGDIFGGLSFDWNLYANEYYAEAMKAFHENYMPSRKILKHTMDKLDALDIEMIAPQHGSIIRKRDVRAYIDILRNLECGEDIFE